MQAILTKFIAPTNTRGTRIKASAAAGSITIAFDHELSIEGNHIAAAEQLCSEFDWTQPAQGSLVTGCLPNGDYCHVMTGV